MACAAERERQLLPRAWREALGEPCQQHAACAGGEAAAAAAGERVTLTLSEEQSSMTAAVIRQHGVTLNSLVQAAWAILLGRLTGRTDVGVRG